MISPGSADDAPGAAALVAACYDDRVVTVAGLRYRMLSARSEDRFGWWKAEVDDRLVGWAYGGLNAFSLTRTTAFAGLLVHPSFRCQGVGAALWDEVSAHLETIGAARIVGQSRSDLYTVEFLLRRSFSMEGTDTSMAVDPRTIGSALAIPAHGIRIAPASELADDLARIFEADRQSTLDEPGPMDFSGMTFETWKQHQWDHPDCDHKLCIVALDGEVVVGTSFLFADRAGGVAANGGTGVIRAYRGRGLGLLMKQHSLARAAEAGITRVFTQNDDTNAPMLAINKRLGYQPFTTGHSWVLER